MSLRAFLNQRNAANLSASLYLIYAFFLSRATASFRTRSCNWFSRPGSHFRSFADAFVHETLGLPQVRIERRWAGIMAFSKDSLPLVGRLPGAPHCFICGGYTGHGNAYALQCARIISELVQGRLHPNHVMLSEAKHPEARLFDPARFSLGAFSPLA